MKFTIPLRKLSDLDVKFISLVDRGANRIPFRIIKSQEKDMSIDLSMLGFRIKKEDSAKANAAPGKVDAVILSTGDSDLAFSIQTVLKTAGIDLPEHTIFDDGTIALHKEDNAYMEDGTVIRLNTGMAVVLTDFDHTLAELKKSAIGEPFVERGYFDGPSLVMGHVQEHIRVSLQKAEGTAASSTIVRDAMESADQYMSLMSKAIPTEILKVEGEIEALTKAFTKKKPTADAAKTQAELDAESAAEDAKDGGVDDTAEAKAACKKAEEDAAAAAVDAAKAVVVDPVVVVDPMEKVLKAMETMASQLVLVTKSVEALSADLSSVKKTTDEKIDAALKKAETAVHAVKGVVIASDLGGDPQPIAKVKKYDGDPRTGVFDSATFPRNR